VGAIGWTGWQGQGKRKEGEEVKVKKRRRRLGRERTKKRKETLAPWGHPWCKVARVGQAGWCLLVGGMDGGTVWGTQDGREAAARGRHADTQTGRHMAWAMLGVPCDRVGAVQCSAETRSSACPFPSVPFCPPSVRPSLLAVPVPLTRLIRREGSTKERRKDPWSDSIQPLFSLPLPGTAQVPFARPCLSVSPSPDTIIVVIVVILSIDIMASIITSSPVQSSPTRAGQDSIHPRR